MCGRRIITLYPSGLPSTSSSRHGLTDCTGPPHYAQRSRAESRAMVSPIEMRGSQLIGRSLIMTAAPPLREAYPRSGLRSRSGALDRRTAWPPLRAFSRYPPFGPPENGHVPNARFEALIRAYERENRRLEDGGKPGHLAGLFLLASRCSSADCKTRTPKMKKPRRRGTRGLLRVPLRGNLMMMGEGKTPSL